MKIEIEMRASDLHPEIPGQPPDNPGPINSHWHPIALAARRVDIDGFESASCDSQTLTLTGSFQTKRGQVRQLLGELPKRARTAENWPCSFKVKMHPVACP